MIEGIEILNTTPITELDFPVVVFAILCVIAIGFGVFVGYKVETGLGVFIGIFIILASLLICLMSSSEVKTGRYKYEAIIEDSANFKEVYQKYDIIEQKGKIYILEDKK